jgi:ribonuclease HI
MGYGWHIANLSDGQISFCGAVEHMPSSTKAEIMAILTSLIVSRDRTTIKIFTDSQQL